MTQDIVPNYSIKPYNDYNSCLKQRYGTKVYRIGVDAGFTCPNRDGTKGTEGCIYCNEDGSRSPYTDMHIPVSEQLSTRINYLKSKKGAEKFIAYFQAFTNTYAPTDCLKEIYDEALAFKDIVGISIGTRPDAIDDDKISLISHYKERYEVWVEYGLQSSHDRTLNFLNRGHTYRDFEDAVKLTKKYHVPVCAHVILGIPGESKDDVIETAVRLKELRIDGVKIHLLHILKGSALEKLHNEGTCDLMEQDAYAEMVCDFLENMPKETIVQRLTGQGSGKNHIAPGWALDKTGTIVKIEEVFKRRGTCQGFRSK